MAQRGSYAKGVAKRTEILDTALEVVARNGFRGTSVRELAESVDLSQAGLLHYFDSKDELFTAILRRRDEVDYALADQHVDIVEQLIAVIRHNADVPGLVQLFASMSTAATSDPSHAAHAYFVERYASIRARVADAIGDRQERGEVPAGLDPTRLATVLLAVSDGMQIQWMLDPGTDMAEHVELVWRLALAAVATPA